MRARWWPHTDDPRIASTRLRCLRVIDALREQGVDAGLYRTEEPAPDVLILAKRYDPASVQLASGLAKRERTRLVLDICDNHFYSATGDPQWEIRRRNLVEAVAAVDLIVTSSHALAEVIAGQAPVRPGIEVIGDIAEAPLDHPPRSLSAGSVREELELLGLKRKLRSSAVPRERRIVWFGNHGSPYADGGMLDLLRVRTPLEEAAHEGALSVTVISNNAAKFRSLRQGWRLPLFYLPWRQRTFSRALRAHGVSIIPAGINPFTSCKTSNRVATSLLHGLVVVADPIPSYLEFEKCILLDAWQSSLRAAATRDVELDRMVCDGRALVEERYSVQAIGRQWARVLTHESLARR